MKKNGILNAQLSQAIAEARHGDTIIILDAGMAVPSDCNYIDLGLVRGIPSFLEVLRAVLNDLVAEQYEVFDLMPQYNPDMYRTIQELLPNIPGGIASEQKIKGLMPAAKAVIRTGEFGSCCNLVLYSASGISRYVEKFHVEFSRVAD